MKTWAVAIGFLCLGFLLQSCSSVGMRDTERPVYEDDEPPKGCPGPAGFVAEGMTVTMYRVAEPVQGAHCESEIRACLNGILTGSYMHLMCNEPQILPTIDANPIVPNSNSSPDSPTTPE